MLNLRIDTKLRKLRRKLQEVLDTDAKTGLFIVTKDEECGEMRQLMQEERDQHIW